ncbi:MAG: alkaline phosphatase family protein [Acidilobus sp.]
MTSQPAWQNFTWPDYSAPNSLYGVACGIASFFQVKRQCVGKPFEVSGRRLVLVYLDALGWDLFQEAGVNVSGRVEKGVTVFPSTTSTALSTLMSAQTPGEHGLLGYMIYNKLLGGVINGIKYSYMGESGSGTILRPLTQAFPVRPWLAETEARVLALMSSGASSGELTRSYLMSRPSPGLTLVKPHSSPYEMLASLTEALQGDPQDMIYVYYDNPDHLGHVYGLNTSHRELAVMEVRTILEYLNRLAEKYRDRYSFLLISDHGQVTVSKIYIFNSDPELMSLLEVPPYGDSRAVWFRSRADLRDLLANKYGMAVMSREEVISSGLLGKVDPWVRDNVMGDYLGVATDSSTKYHYLYRDDDPALKLKGHHSGLTPQEMQIPIAYWE